MTENKNFFTPECKTCGARGWSVEFSAEPGTDTCLKCAAKTVEQRAPLPNAQQLQAAGFAKFCDACGGDVRSNGMDTVCVACGTLVP